MPDALYATILPLYPGLGQALNMLACVPAIGWLEFNVSFQTNTAISETSVPSGVPVLLKL